MSDKKISPSSAGTGSGDLSPFTQVGGTPSVGLSEVFLKMAHNTPEEAAASLRSATMGRTLTGEWDLEEEEVVQLWLVEAEGKVCGGPVGPMSEGRFCVERALEDTGACGKAKGHTTKKHKELTAGWYIGAGERARSGAFLVPRLDVEKIPVEAWGMLLNEAQPMRAPRSVWLAFFELAAETPVSLESMVSMLDRKVDAELAGMRKYTRPIDHEDGDEDELEPKSQEPADTGDTMGRALQEELLGGLMRDVRDLQQEGERERMKTATMAAIIEDLNQKAAESMNEAREVMRQLGTMQTRDYQSTLRVLELERQLNQMRADGSRAVGLSPDEKAALAEIGPIKTMAMGSQANLGKLQLEMSMVRSRAAGQGVQIGRFNFSSYPELRLFVETKMKDNYGLILDVVSLLHSIDASYVDPDQAVATEASRLRAKYGSPLEMKVATSFKTSFPSVMFRDTTSVGPSAAATEGYLGPGMGSIEKWDARDGVSGTKFVIENGIRRMEDSIPFEIEENLEGDGADLARYCFGQSVSFAHHLTTFIDTFFLEMSNAAGFKGKEAWDLVTAVLVKVFSDLRDARAIAQDSRGAAGFIWGTLQAHMVMKRFLKHNFKRDPGLNAILVQFILKKKQSDATNVLGGINIKNLETQVKKLERDVANLKTTARGAANA
jgi:Asp-tRNA(Asn)/Glu-tRNA(Gln) amidotransferase C subunit